MSKLKITKFNLDNIVIVQGKDLTISTLEIARHILAGSRQKTESKLNYDLVKIVKTYLAGFKELGSIRFETESTNSAEYALLNEPQTNLLFMSMRNTNPIVWQFKLQLAKRFDQLKKLVIQRQNAEWLKYRQDSKIVTKSMNDSFTRALDYCGKPHDTHRYINLQQAIYKAALGKTAQALRKERNIPPHRIIRDYLNPHELQLVSSVQSITELSLQQFEQVDDAMILRAIDNAGSALKLVANSLFLSRVA